MVINGEDLNSSAFKCGLELLSLQDFFLFLNLKCPVEQFRFQKDKLIYTYIYTFVI